MVTQKKREEGRVVLIVSEQGWWRGRFGRAVMLNSGVV
jgi:hypothetical protein